MSRSFLLLSTSLATFGWICGATGVGAQAGTSSQKALSSLSEESSLAALGQTEMPWWAKDMRLSGSTPAAQRDLREILAQNRRERALKSLLGDHRWRSFDSARFAMEVDSLGFTSDPEEDRTRQSEIKSEMRRNFFRLARENLQERLGLEERAERYLARITPRKWLGRSEGGDSNHGDVRSGSLGVRFSPRLSVGHSTKLGFKMQPTGLSSSVLSGASLRVGYDFRYDDTRLVLEIEHPRRDRELFFEFRSNDEHQGQSLQLSIRFSY